jgi:hypothetical protein
MERILLAILLVVALLGILLGFGSFIISIFRKIGYPKAGKLLAIFFYSFLILGALVVTFGDYFFTKSEAKKLIAPHHVTLTDNFIVISNYSTIAPGSYYHTFTLSISPRDHLNAIKHIKTAKDFLAGTNKRGSLIYQGFNKYFGPTLKQNYEDSTSLITEYFQPSGRKGYAPTFRRVSVSKLENKLIYEDIDL